MTTWAGGRSAGPRCFFVRSIATGVLSVPVPGPLRGLRFDLARCARLDVMAPPPQLAENARLLHLSLEMLHRPFDAIGVRENELRHAVLRREGRRHESARVGRP